MNVVGHILFKTGQNLRSIL